MTKTTVGRFTLNEDGSLVGPADYMNSASYKSCIDSIYAGTSVVFNMGCTESPNVETALLVAVQTDYAAWAGAQGLFAMERKARG